MQNIVLDEVYDIWPTSFWSTWLGWATVLLVAVAIIAAIYLFFVLMRWYSTVTVPARILTQLNGLQQLPEADSKKIYQQLSSSIKQFFIFAKSMPKGLTDFEVASWLESQPVSQEQRAMVQRVLANAQTAKFGQLLLSRQQIAQDITNLINFVKSTKDTPV